jgi:DNA polymerase I
MLDENDHHNLNRAINFKVQSLASDVCLSSLIELHQEFKKRNLAARILLTIHDCIVFELPIQQLDECLNLIEDVMTKSRFPDMPGIPIDGKMGQSWGETVKIKRKGMHWSTEDEKLAA